MIRGHNNPAADTAELHELLRVGLYTVKKSKIPPDLLFDICEEFKIDPAEIVASRNKHEFSLDTLSEQKSATPIDRKKILMLLNSLLYAAVDMGHSLQTISAILQFSCPRYNVDINEVRDEEGKTLSELIEAAKQKTRNIETRKIFKPKRNPASAPKTSMQQPQLSLLTQPAADLSSLSAAALEPSSPQSQQRQPSPLSSSSSSSSTASLRWDSPLPNPQSSRASSPDSSRSPMGLDSPVTPPKGSFLPLNLSSSSSPAPFRSRSTLTPSPSTALSALSLDSPMNRQRTFFTATPPNSSRIYSLILFNQVQTLILQVQDSPSFEFRSATKFSSTSNSWSSCCTSILVCKSATSFCKFQCIILLI